MSDALMSGVSGLQASQTMLDVAGNNLANLDTTAFKAGTVSFSDTLSQTLQEATQPTATTGGINPMQIGNGVQVASIGYDMTQGTMESTGQPLDMAINGAGYFVLNNGQSDVYTRAGSFAVDSNDQLVDPSTGYLVQRIGSEGVAQGFQNPATSSITVPYNAALPAQATTTVSFSGNLSADESSPTTNQLTSGVTWTLGTGDVASASSLLSSITSANLAVGDTIQITGTEPDGSYIGGAAAGATFTYAAGDTVQNLLDAINTAVPGATATLSNGQIQITDNASGYSQTDVNLTYTPVAANTTGSFPLPSNFTVLTAGGAESQNVTMQVFDQQGISHTVSGTFVRSDTNTWDFVADSITGGATLLTRRIDGIKFMSDGSYAGIVPTTGPDGQPTTSASGLQIAWASDPANPVSLKFNMGTVGGFDGLSQFGGAATAASSGQDGYASGSLSSLSVTGAGVLVGAFTNGQHCNIATLQMATFQNPSGLESVGQNYFTTSTNSGEAVATTAQAGGAGSVVGGSLEKSNVDEATEFTNLMTAQNGYQANARTIQTADDMLKELIAQLGQ